MPSLRLLIFVTALIFLIVNVQLGMVSIAFDKLGLSRDSAYLLLMLTLLGSMINVPLFSVASEPAEGEQELPEFNRLRGLSKRESSGRTLIAVNVGGAVTPVAFSLYLLFHNPLDPLQVIGVVSVVTVVAYLSSDSIRGVGIAIPIFVAPISAAMISLMVNQEMSAPLAYIGGTLGVLIGADLLKLSAIRRLGTPFASIGGAGTFDGIFLAGMLAVLLA